METLRGTVVKSFAGHDKDSFFVVLRVEGDFAYISNGKTRTLENPKKKRLKHLKHTHTVIDCDSLTNRKLRTVLNEFNNKTQEEQAGTE